MKLVVSLLLVCVGAVCLFALLSGNRSDPDGLDAASVSGNKKNDVHAHMLEDASRASDAHKPKRAEVSQGRASQDPVITDTAEQSNFWEFDDLLDKPDIKGEGFHVDPEQLSRIDVGDVLVLPFKKSDVSLSVTIIEKRVNALGVKTFLNDTRVIRDVTGELDSDSLVIDGDNVHIVQGRVETIITASTNNGGLEARINNETGEGFTFEYVDVMPEHHIDDAIE